MKLPIPADLERCLAHLHDPSGKDALRGWCEKLATCARHQSIKLDAFDEAYSVHTCLCTCARKLEYIEAES